MEAKLKVKLVAHTINPELTIATAGKLCYSASSIEDLMEKQTDEGVAKFVNMLINLQHESPLEHTSFTFAIEGVSRALTHQLVRHRIASFSQQSQRYVKEKQFDFIVPRDIKKDSELVDYYYQHMFMTQALYDVITDGLLFNYFTGADEVAFLARECTKAKVDRYDLIDTLKNKMVEILGLELSEDEIELMSPHSLASQVKDIENKRLILFEVFEQDMYKKLLSSLTKRAIENARYVFPNAIETKIMVTMNLRSLINFCKHRCCRRSQEEIQHLAFAMRDEVAEISPLLARCLGASCQFGNCPEGNMTCGKPYSKL